MTTRPASSANTGPAADVQYGRNAYYVALTPSEQTKLHRTIEEVGDHGCVSLSQSLERCSHNGGSRFLTTLVKNSFTWSIEAGRWMPPSELLVRQGFPLYPALQINGADVSSFNRSRESFNLPPRVGCHVTSQAGNTMDINMLGAAFLWWMSSICQQHTSASSPSDSEQFAPLLGRLAHRALERARST